jgi:polyphenol oxidase
MAGARVGFVVVVVVVVVLGLVVVEGLPFPAPRVNDCMSWEGCCPPRSNVAPVAFKFPSRRSTMRTRVAAHLVDATYIAKYKRAYALMRKLPASDPRSLMAQARLHCAYCGGAFTYPNSQYALEIHDGWFFFAWHRMFLYFHERILASLINDPTFALQFWNWDNQSPSAPQPSNGAANSLPIYFASPASRSNSLWDRNRNRCALPPNTIDLNSGGGCSNSSPRSLRTENTRLMATQMRTATTPTLFFGSTYRFGESGGLGGGNIEGAPHGTVHVFTGDPNAPSNPYDDMGNLDVAAQDPLFYAHHANIDRLWLVWKTAGGRGNRVDISDKDYLNSQFIFFDENKKLISITVSDVLDLTKLRYSLSLFPSIT